MRAPAVCLAWICAGAFTWASGCGADRSRVYVDIPQRDDTRSVILAVHLESGLRVEAVDLEGEGVHLDLETMLGDDESVLVEALLYERRLDQLGIQPGPVMARADNLLFPQEGREVVQGTVGAQKFSGWSERPEPTAELALFRGTQPDPTCTTFVARQIPLASTVDLAFALGIDERSALLGTLDGQVFWVTSAGAERVADIPAALPFGTGFLSASGEMWFGGSFRPLYRGNFAVDNGTPRLSARPASTATVPGDLRFIDGTADGDSVEIYTLDYLGVLSRFDGTTVTPLHEFEGESVKGGLVALGAGSVVAGMSSEPRIIRVTGTTVVDETPATFTSGVTALQRVAGFDILAASGPGGTLHRRSPDEPDETWRALDVSPIAVDVRSMGPFRGGFLQGGALGIIAQFRGAWCPEEQVGSGVVRAVLPFEGGLLLAHDPPRANQPATATILEVID